jgi:hypothetical protein
VLTLKTRKKREDARRERQLSTVRSLIRYCELLAELIMQRDPTSHEREYVYDTISDGESLLKELGGCAIR